MNAKKEIIDSIRKHSIEKFEMPELAIPGLPQTDPEEGFINACRLTGGNVVLLDEPERLPEVIRDLYPEAKNIVSDLALDGIKTLNPDGYDRPHQLANTDVAIIKGTFGIAENGAIWIPKNTKHRALYFIAENLIILLDRNNLVSTMHDAYERIAADEYEFGVFISGPSKTADIEQALVIGAHGAKSVTVILR